MRFLDLFENSFHVLFPELFLAGVTTVLLLFGAICSTSKAHGYPLLLENVTCVALLSIVCAFFLTFHMPFFAELAFFKTFIVDEFTTALKCMILLSAASSLLMSTEYLKTTAINAFEYAILVLFSTISMLLMVSSYDLISMYLAIEMQSLCFYVLAAAKRQSEFSTEAGLKYFLLGAFSSGILLFGCSLVYGSTGTTNLEDIAQCLVGFSTTQEHVHVSLLHIGVFLLSIGFLFKLTAAPFHFWAPDVYEGAPTSVTAFFAIVPKIAILGMFLRLLFLSFYDIFASWKCLLLFCSVSSLLIGAFGAMAQKKIKRLLVYSSIGHVGFLLMGLCCGTVDGLQAVLLYLIIYTVMTVNVFAAVLSCTDHTGMHRMKYSQDLGLLAQTNGVLAFTLSCTLFSMSGIPPLAGFSGKFHLFQAVMMDALLLPLAVIGVLSSVLSCFYYIRLIKIMYFEQPSQKVTYQAIDREKATLLGLTTFFIVFFFWFPESIVMWTKTIALSLVPGGEQYYLGGFLRLWW